MYSGMLKTPFPLEESSLRYVGEREGYVRFLQREKEKEKSSREEKEIPLPVAVSLPTEEKNESVGLRRLLELVSPEDSALLSLIVFLLCDNTENDVVLLGILLYVLLSK